MATFDVLRSGRAGRLLPDNFPPRQTVYGWLLRLRDARSGAAEPTILVMLVPRAQRARRQPFGGGAR